MTNKTIAITEEVKEKLINLKLCPTETYDNIIYRLLIKEEKRKKINKKNKQQKCGACPPHGH